MALNRVTVIIVSPIPQVEVEDVDVEAPSTREHDLNILVILLDGLTDVESQIFTYVKAFYADGVSLVMVMGSPHVKTVHINNVFPSYGISVVSLILLTYALWEQPI